MLWIFNDIFLATKQIISKKLMVLKRSEPRLSVGNYVLIGNETYSGQSNPFLLQIWYQENNWTWNFNIKKSVWFLYNPYMEIHEIIKCWSLKCPMLQVIFFTPPWCTSNSKFIKQKSFQWLFTGKVCLYFH